jgi:uncharacterized protein
MRVVIDTNTAVSGLLWRGAPSRVIDAAVGRLPEELLHEFSQLVTLVQPKPIAPLVIADPDDDAVVACALAAQAYVIVSGDSHLLDLGDVQGIPVLSATAFLDRLPPGAGA